MTFYSFNFIWSFIQISQFKVGFVNAYCFKEALQKMLIWMLQPGSLVLSVKDECVRH